MSRFVSVYNIHHSTGSHKVLKCRMPSTVSVYLSVSLSQSTGEVCMFVANLHTEVSHPVSAQEVDLICTGTPCKCNTPVVLDIP